MSRLDLLSVLFVVPAFISAFIRQRVYNYRFMESELVVRDGLLTKNVRRISYDRIHNVALVRNPIHRMLAVATARIETAAGGKPEALLRVVSLEAAEELRRYTLAEGHRAASTNSVERAREVNPPLQVPDRELVRLGLISNRGFLVVAAALGAAAQVQGWNQGWFEDQDWQRIYEGVRARAPGWASWLFDSGTTVGRVFLGLATLVLLLVIIRVFSMAWYLVRYRGFTLHQKGENLRADYGLWPEVSSVIPVHRIQLVTVSASLLHRWFSRASIDLETAGTTDSNSELAAASGAASTRLWLAPIIETDRAYGLVRDVLPDVDIEGVEWNPIEARAVRRISSRIAIAVTPITIGIAALFALAPIPLSGWHALWLPLVVLTTAWLASRQWVRRTGYALSDCAIYFRSGWISRQVSVVRFVNIQTVSMKQSPFDYRNRMASVAVDTAGAGSSGHRIHIPFLDVEVAKGILRRLYEETRCTEFRW
ncbi:MAG: PH domain-containing protein [Acidobacteriota bacterium]|nr:PH domain-containing protein [Acidobacteriota bacterium]